MGWAAPAAPPGVANNATAGNAIASFTTFLIRCLHPSHTSGFLRLNHTWASSCDDPLRLGGGSAPAHGHKTSKDCCLRSSSERKSLRATLEGTLQRIQREPLEAPEKTDI